MAMVIPSPKGFLHERTRLRILGCCRQAAQARTVYKRPERDGARDASIDLSPAAAVPPLPLLLGLERHCILRSVVHADSDGRALCLRRQPDELHARGLCDG